MFNLKEYRKQYYIDNCDEIAEKTFNHRVNNIKKYKIKEAKIRANELNIECSITEDDFILNEICPILDISLFVSKGTCTDNSISIDRIDNKLGYIKGNVRIISHKANTSKSNSTREEYNLLTKNLNHIFLERNLLSEEEIERIKQINPYFPNTPSINQ